MPRGFAFFDLDQTLLPWDTQTLFCNFILRRHRLRTAYLGLFLPALPFAALKLLQTRQLKRLFLSYLWRMPVAQLDAEAKMFATSIVKPLLYADVLAELERHRADGRLLILNTASPQIYARHISLMLGFDQCFATEASLPAHGRMPLFPDIPGPNNKRAAKLQAMAHLLPSLTGPLENSWAYSDSLADLPMLELAEHPTLVNPDKKLEALGIQRHWPILRPPRPWATHAGFLAASALQAAGLFNSR